MRFTKTLVAAAAIAVTGSTAFAGNPAPVAADPVIVLPPVEAAPTSSVPAGYIVLGLVAALVAASGSF